MDNAAIEEKIKILKQKKELTEKQIWALENQTQLSSLKPKDRFYLIFPNGDVYMEDVFIKLDMNYFELKNIYSNNKYKHAYINENTYKLHASIEDMMTVKL